MMSVSGKRPPYYGASVGMLVLRLLLLTAILAVATFACLRIFHVNATTAGFLFLLVIFSIAPAWGVIESTYASVLAVLLFNFYFLPPIGTLTIADPQNWVALLAFLGTSIVASQLIAALRKQAEQATTRQREMEQLYSLSRAILLIDPAGTVGEQLALHVARVCESPGVVLFDKEANRFYHAGPADIAEPGELLRDVALRGTYVQDAARRLTITAIRLGADPIGSLALAESTLSDGAMQGLANLIAIGMERAAAYQRASRAEAARQSDELKSTLLDAVAHEFKTPLTSIKAASTALLSNVEISPEERRELLDAVDEEADRLSGLVTDAIQMARIESGSLKLNFELCSAAHIISGAIKPLQRGLEGRRVQIDVNDNLRAFFADPELLEIALRQFVDNAAKYSPAGSLIRIAAAEAHDTEMVFTVEDQGAGIPEGERNKLFERFYRSPATRQSVAGAGLGLAIARDIAKAHGGTAWVDGEGDKGLAFHFSVALDLKEQE